MNSLQWNDAKEQKDPAQPGARPDFWFGASMVLIGIVVGYMAGQFSGAGLTFARTAPPSVAQAPAAVAAPTPPSPAPAPASESATNVIPVDFNKDHIRGSTNATLAVIEYSDFECPFCKRVHPTMQQLLEQNKGKIMWVYRHYPLPFHQNAAKESEATECANELGGNTAFWKYTDLIFDRTTSGGTGIALEQLPTMAKEIGLSEQKFKTCLDSGKYAQAIQAEEQSGAASGIQGTPGTIVLNLKTQQNRLVSGAQPLANFQAAIDALLQ